MYVCVCVCLCVCVYARVCMPAGACSRASVHVMCAALCVGPHAAGPRAVIVLAHRHPTAPQQVAPDGTTLLAPGQRVLFGHWVSVGQPGGQLPLAVIRDGQRLGLTMT